VDGGSLLRSVYDHPVWKALALRARSSPARKCSRGARDTPVAPYDLTTKAELYARGGIPEYWVVDLVHRTLVVFRNPEHGVYRVRETHHPGSRLAPLSWPDFPVEVGALFPSEPT
jgi:hypothetical protein